MKKRILTGITTTGTPHIGNYLGAIKPALDLVEPDNDSYFFLADYHALIKQNDPNEIEKSVKNVALAWLSSGLDPKKSNFYRQSDIPEVHELTWILNCSASKGLLNRAHAYKSMAAENTQTGNDEDKAINMGLFSYPVLMAADILMFDSTHVPVGSDQNQHIEMTRDIATRFNHLYGPVLTVPESIIQDKEKVVLGLDGRKMSKSYGNVIPLLESEKTLKKSIMKIVTNSLEPGEPKDSKDCTVFDLYKNFATEEEVLALQSAYDEGISWGDAKQKLFLKINSQLEPIRNKHDELQQNKDYINDVLHDGAKKAKSYAIEKISQIKEVIGISKIT